MARAGQGSSSIVRDNTNIRQSVMKQLERALQPGLTDIHVTWNDASTGKPLPDGTIRQTPMNPPPIFRGTRLVTFALVPDKCPACKVVLTGSFGDSQFTSEVDVDPSKVENTAGDQIVKLGVRSMIEDLQNGLGGIPKDKTDDIKKAVVDLSVKHGILSNYTAFIAVGSGGEALEASMVTRRVSRRSHMHMMMGGGRGGFAMRKACKANFCFAPMAMASCCAAPPRMMAMKCAAPAPRMEMGSMPPLSAPCACPPPPAPCGACAPAFDSRKHESAAPRARMAAPMKSESKAEEKPLEKNLDNVILQQKASGCFNEKALSLLDIAESAKGAIPKERPDGVDDKLALDIWVTLLVLAGLQKKFADKSSEWSFIAKKSEKWAQTKLGASYDAWKAAATAAI